MGSHTEKIIERELEIYWKWKIYAIVWAEERIEVFYVLVSPCPSVPVFFQAVIIVQKYAIGIILALTLINSCSSRPTKEMKEALHCDKNAIRHDVIYLTTLAFSTFAYPLVK